MNEITEQRIILAFEVSNANPNGDPNNDNRPRQLPNGQGIISNGSMKRKIRDFMLSDSEYLKDILNKLGISEQEYKENYNILESENRGFYDKNFKEGIDAFNQHYNSLLKEKGEFIAKQEVIKKYFDVRVFGSVYLIDKNLKHRDCGAVTVSDFESYSPIETYSNKIVRSNSPDQAKDFDKTGNKNQFGEQHFVKYGLYGGYININQAQAIKNSVTQKDINLLCNIIPYIFTTSQSACRPVSSFNFIQYYSVKPINGTILTKKIGRIMNSLSPTRIGDNNSPANNLNDYTLKTKADIDPNILKNIVFTDGLEEDFI